MQSFAEFMAESYRSSVHLTWNLAGLKHAAASFTIDSVKVIVSFEQRDEQRNDPAPWHVSFEVDKGEKTEVAYSAFAIFNGVFQSVQAVHRRAGARDSCLRNQTRRIGRHLPDLS